MRPVDGSIRGSARRWEFEVVQRLRPLVLQRLSAAVRAALAVLALVCVVAPPAAAHDIPADVKINAFFKPAGDRLELLVRLPLASLIDTDFPTRPDGSLDIARADEPIRGGIKVWLTDNIDVYENGMPLEKPRIVAELVSMPSDKSFGSFEAARAHVLGQPLSSDLDLFWSQIFLDVLLEYKIQSDHSEFAIDMRVDRLGGSVNTALRFMPPGGAVRAFEFHGATGLVYLDPRWYQAVLRFVVEGFWHILDGTDHLLFLACLVIPVRRLRPLVVVVTAFTVAHSITLFASAFGYAPDALWFPPLIETLIAATIVFMALENIVGIKPERRWIYAFAFGLIHGFGFSFALREQLQFAGEHLVTSLLGFNLGVEIGQLCVLIVLVPALNLLFKYVVDERMGVIILSVLVAHTGWHWMIERGEELAKFPFPTLNAAFFASVMRGLMAVLILIALVWLASGFVRRFMQGKDGVADKTLAKAPAAERR
jgi:HupE / UreJ protein